MTARLPEAAPGLPEHELTRLRQVATGKSRTDLILDPALAPDEEARLDALVARRLAGEPLQYVEGTVPFGGLEIAVDRRALIPRPETEQLLALVLAQRPDAVAIVDVGTGSGNLALALRHSIPTAAVYATDVSRDAITLARENALRLGLDVAILEGDLFDPLPMSLHSAVDLVVSNPPYVPAGALLPADVARHEPPVALFAGDDGLDVLRRLAAEVSKWLAPGGLLACEIGETQGEACREIFAALGPRVLRDYTGRDRFLVGQRPDRE